MIYYKIRKKSDPDMYVSGTPLWHEYRKTGHFFETIGQLRSFLSGTINRGKDLSDWEVVGVEIVVKETRGIHEVLTAKKLKEILMK